MKHIYFFITLMILITTDVTAQVTLTAPTKMVRTGDSVVVELRAKSQDALSTLQFTLSWNASLLSFGRVDTLGGFPPSALVDEFGYGSTSQGKLTYVWLSTATAGLRITDSIEIFRIFFKVTGVNGTNSPIQFVTSPTQIKASNANLVAISVTTQEGNVKIGTTATDEPILSNISVNRLQLEQNKPNPFHNQTTIPFYLPKSEDVVLSIYDIYGHKVLEKKGFYLIGNHEMVLNTEGVLANGVYVYRLRTRHAVESRMFIKN